MPAVELKMDWKALEQQLFDTSRSLLQALLEQGGAPLYAAAFHASYREEDAVLSLPSFAVNSQQALDENFPDEDDQSFSSVKWNPADWQWDWDISDYASQTLLALDQALQAFANRGTPHQWRSAERRLLVTVARAARALGKHFSGHPGVSEHFIVIFHDFSGDTDLAKRSISHAQFAANFPVELEIENTLRHVATLPLTEQAAFYLSRLHCYNGVSGETAERWLIAHGALAQQGLLEQLQQHKQPTTAARILGLAGLADPAVIEALRQHALHTHQPPLRNWCATALGYLGDFDWLIEQEADLAVSGFCANLGSFRWRAVRPPVLDYAPLERLLEQRPELATAVEEHLGEQYGDMSPTTADLNEAIRGLGLAHAAIRRHAVSALHNRELQGREFERAVAALQGAAGDQDRALSDLAKVGLEGMR